MLKQEILRTVYRDLKANAHEVRRYHNEVRRLAWQLANAHRPRKWPFWRHGFRAHYGRRVDLRGYVAVPRYDEIAQEVSIYFPEYGTDDGCERLWELLLSPYDRLPSRQELMDQAAALTAEAEELNHEPCPF